MLKKALFSIAALMLGYVVIAMWWSPRPTPLFIPPVTLADGSVEYQLIDRGADGMRGTEDDPVWVLRFPKGMYVRNPDLSRSEFEIANTPNWKNNWNLSFSVKLPDLTLVENPYDEPNHSILRVALNAPPVIYGSGQYNEPELSFSSNIDKYARFICRPGREIFPGIFQLRAPNDAEIQAAENELRSRGLGSHPGKYSYLRLCSVGKEDSDRYLIHDKSGAILGSASCFAHAKSAGGALCSARVWLPQNRDALLSFDGQHLRDIQKIRHKVVALLTAATDTAKSRNLGP
ncbi:hypothetical protein K3X13_08575 [Aliiroseovarius crassostreae]|uniref:Uncharacterized protein n=1 Tax=Aliiroseovarius crassostreae TaxID=154981 RepID=A0A9Q9LYD4_9RHOB|nr:hypothetical protein [Aliiroseovarius crassostreae]UWP91151.1 hypothetical protein K3X13_08575 [Aliiroseovarius crassostreae]UWP94338.1 hypothetical protein K3X48_08750 [Aliiroseovarius crassostreae]UWP97463.1 hypothetical protein K3X53_08575 [Aliiroseovarius crassostreae]